MLTRAISGLACLVLITSPTGLAQEHKTSALGPRPGTELVFVYFGGSNCGPCKTPAVKGAVRNAKELLAQQAKDRGIGFSTIGVALDRSVEAGVEFLKDVGPFDQIVVGRTDHNLAALEYLVADRQSALAVPQIVLFEQTLTDAPKISATEPKFLNSIWGGARIVQWANSGAQVYR